MSVPQNDFILDMLIEEVERGNLDPVLADKMTLEQACEFLQIADL